MSTLIKINIFWPHQDKDRITGVSFWLEVFLMTSSLSVHAICLLPQGLDTPRHVIKVTICISMLFHPQYKLQSGSGQGLNPDTTIYIESCQTDIVLTRMTEFTI